MTEPLKLRVATYNIRKSIGLDWRRKPGRIIDVLSEIDADIIALQEADRRFGDRSATLTPEALSAAGWRFRQVSEDSDSLGWHGNAVISRPDVTIERATPIALPAFEPRGAIAVTMRKAGKSFAVIGLHLGLLRRHRDRQIATILAHAEHELGCPTIIMGDTNEWRRRSAGLVRMTGAHKIAPPLPTFHTTMPILALDRIVVTPEFEIGACGVHRSERARKASDHLPLWADLALHA